MLCRRVCVIMYNVKVNVTNVTYMDQEYIDAHMWTQKECGENFIGPAGKALRKVYNNIGPTPCICISLRPFMVTGLEQGHKIACNVHTHICEYYAVYTYAIYIHTYTCIISSVLSRLSNFVMLCLSLNGVSMCFADDVMSCYCNLIRSG